MGCCLFALVLAGAPRIALALWWLFEPGRFDSAFESGIIMPLLGLIFLPWVTLAWVFVSPGGVGGFDWIILALAVVIDLSSWGGGEYSRRRR